MAGNANSGPKREKPFREALNMEIIEAGPDHKALRLIARSLLDQAYSGKMDAIKEVADRMDGKVPQGIIGGDADDPAVQMITEIRRTVVRPGS